MSERALSSKLTADVGDFQRTLGQAEAVVKRFSQAAEDNAKAAGLAKDAQGKWRNAQGQFVSAAERARRGIENTTAAADKSTQSSTKAATAWSKMATSATKNEQAWRAAGTTFTAVGAAAAAGVGAAVVAYTRFDAAMSKVQSSTGETGDGLDSLRQKALKAGADTSFSATEAAAGIEELAKAGLATQDVLNGGLDGALALAAAGSLEVADAAEITATALKQFKQPGSEASRVADLLANGANKAQGGVGDLGQALGQSGLVASQFGLDVDEAVGTLTAFANAGLIGSDAGTSFRTMLLALANPSKESKELMDELGIAAYDAGGNFVGTEALAGQLQDRLGGLTQAQRDQALATIFGSDAIRGANVLLNEGAEGIATWRDEVDQAGAAAATAAINMDNLSGDLEGLRGSLETALIGTGESADGPLRQLVQGLDGTVDAYNRMPDGAKSAALAIGNTTAAAGLAAGAFLTVAPRVLDTITQFQTLRADMPGTARGLGRVAKAAGVAGAALAGIQAVRALAGTGTDDLGRVAEVVDAINNLDTNGAERLDELANAAGSGTTSVRGLGDAVDTLGLGGFGKGVDKAASLFGVFDSEVGLATEAVSRYDQALATLVTNGATDQAAQGADYLSGLVRASGQDFEEFSNQYLPAYNDSLLEMEQQQQAAAQTTAALTGSFAELPGATGAAMAGVMTMPTTFNQLVESMGLTEDAADGLRDTFIESGETMLGFAEPLATYTDLLDRKTEADRRQAEETAANTEDQADSWEDYVTTVGVSVTEYLDEQRRMVDAQTNWQTNMLKLAGRVSQGTLDELGRMGPEGAPLVAELVTASDAQLAEMDDLFAGRAEDATFAWGEKLRLAGPVLAQIAATAGEDAANAAAEALGRGTATIEEIAREYGVALADGVNPVLTAVGKERIRVQRSGRQAAGRGLQEADGGVVSYYADGGLRENHVAQIAPAGAWRVWAEPETEGEAYIPLAASKRPRSTAIWEETGRRLGIDVDALGLAAAGPAPLLGPAHRLRLELAA